MRQDPPHNSASAPAREASPPPAVAAPLSEERLAELESAPPAWTPRSGRRTMREKLGAGLLGLKHAVRGDSSFFAHGYRTLLIALAAALLGVGPLLWCLIVLAAALILVAELGHSALDTLARALGNPDDPGVRIAREIATAGVLVAVTVAWAVWIIVLVVRLGELLGW